MDAEIYLDIADCSTGQCRSDLEAELSAPCQACHTPVAHGHIIAGKPAASCFLQGAYLYL